MHARDLLGDNHAHIPALHALDALSRDDADRRIAVATAYNVEVTDRLKAFLEEYGFDVVNAKGLGYEQIPAGGDIIDNRLTEFCAETFEGAKGADTLLISCGGLKTLDLIVPLEKRCKVPVVSSTPHALMASVRLVGRSGRARGFGRVLERAL